MLKGWSNYEHYLLQKELKRKPRLLCALLFGRMLSFHAEVLSIGLQYVPQSADGQAGDKLPQGWWEHYIKKGRWKASRISPIRWKIWQLHSRWTQVKKNTDTLCGITHSIKSYAVSLTSGCGIAFFQSHNTAYTLTFRFSAFGKIYWKNLIGKSLECLFNRGTKQTENFSKKVSEKTWSRRVWYVYLTEEQNELKISQKKFRKKLDRVEFDMFI